jgi:hypothetical protein
MKTTDHTLICGLTPTGFEETIRFLQTEGWQPLGTPFTLTPRDREAAIQLHQAMIKQQRIGDRPGDDYPAF